MPYIVVTETDYSVLADVCETKRNVAFQVYHSRMSGHTSKVYEANEIEFNNSWESLAELMNGS